MTTVPAHQAGAGSAVNDTIREVGGAMGIAIVGSLSAALFRSRLGSTLATAHVPHRVSDLAGSSIAAADAVGRQAGGVRGAELISAAHSAFVSAMATSIRVAAAVALAAAIGAVFALPRRGAGRPRAGCCPPAPAAGAATAAASERAA